MQTEYAHCLWRHGLRLCQLLEASEGAAWGIWASDWDSTRDMMPGESVVIEIRPIVVEIRAKKRPDYYPSARVLVHRR